MAVVFSHGKKSGTAEDVSPLSLSGDRGVFFFERSGFYELPPMWTPYGGGDDAHLKIPLLDSTGITVFPRSDGRGGAGAPRWRYHQYVYPGPVSPISPYDALPALRLSHIPM